MKRTFMLIFLKFMLLVEKKFIILI